MKVYWKTVVAGVLMCLGLITINGCIIEALEFAAPEFAVIAPELATVEGMEGVFTMEAATGMITVADEEAFLSALQRVKLEEPSLLQQNARVYIEENGTRKYFGEVIDDKTIEITEHGINKNIAMPEGMSIYRVKGNAVNIRYTPEINNYNLYKLRQLHTDDVVLVLRRYNTEWYEIQIDKTHIGYVYASLLTAAALSHANQMQSLAAANTTHSSLYIISPQEKATIDYPRNTTVVWNAIPGATVYIVRVELSGPPYDYSVTDFYPMPYSNQGIYTTTETSLTFPGMGKQVHRFKVIAKQGDVTLAETAWRYVRYSQ